VRPVPYRTVFGKHPAHCTPPPSTTRVVDDARPLPEEYPDV